MKIRAIWGRPFSVNCERFTLVHKTGRNTEEVVGGEVPEVIWDGAERPEVGKVTSAHGIAYNMGETARISIEVLPDFRR